VSRGAVLRSALGCVKHNKEMFLSGTLVSLVMADPWSFWGKPTGSGVRPATAQYYHIDTIKIMFIANTFISQH